MKDINTELKNKIKTIPPLPGIYKMIDVRGQVIYVGKSKCLKKRVQSYFVKDHKWEKIKKLVSRIHDIDYTVTDTHLEARLLECELIKTLKPFFNFQMKNDRRYVYLQLKNNYPHSALAIVNERTDNAYGPFRSRNLLDELIGLLKNIYPISFDGSRYIFEYHIFPVVMDRDTYFANLKILMELLDDEGKMSLFISQAEEKMNKAAEDYRYELACIYRDIINGLKYIRHGINGYKEIFSKRLVLKIPTVDGIKLFYVNKGNILLSEKYNGSSLPDHYLKDFIDKGNAVLKDFIDKGISVSENFIDKRNAISRGIPASDDETTVDKATLDYRDILYSEINSLSEDMILLQD